MRNVYTASNSIQAHLVKILLQGEGIQAHVAGDYLQGAMGELPVVGMMEVMVDESDLQRARTIILEWEANDDEEDDSWIPSELR
jgi:hypothetical protein